MRKNETATPKTQTAAKPAENKKVSVKPSYNDNTAYIIVPALVATKTGYETRFSDSEKIPLNIPTKCTDKNAFVLDTEHYVLQMVKDKAEKAIIKLEKKQQETKNNPEKPFTEKDENTLKQQKALLELCSKNLKKFPLRKNDSSRVVVNLPAKMAAAVITNTSLNIDCKTVAVYIKSAFNTALTSLESLYDGDTVILSKEEQADITNVKNAIKEAFDIFFQPVPDRVEGFTLSISNKDVAKIVFSIYDGFKHNRKTGSITDGLKLDNKNEKKLCSVLTNYVYGKISGSTF